MPNYDYYRIKTNKIIRVSILLISFLFVAASCSFSNKSKSVQAPDLIKTQKPKYSLYEVKKRPLAKSMTVYGTVSSAREQELYFKVKQGRLKAMYCMLGDQVKKGQVLAEMESDDLDIQIERQELKVKKAQLAYEELIELCAGKYDTDIAALELELEKTELNYLKEQLDNRKLVATMDGKITSIISYKTGEMIPGYSTVYIISDPNYLHIQCVGRTAADLSVGMKADIDYKGKKYSGIITSQPIAELIPYSMDMMKYYTYAQFDKQPPELKLGENVAIYVDLVKKDSTFAVPRKAIHTFDGQKYVMVMDGEEIVERYVETGIETELEVEIVSGLKEGDKVITN
jgi:RND family efflux transporter MFP subunit